LTSLGKCLNRPYKRVNSSYILIDDNKKIYADTSEESIQADITIQIVVLMVLWLSHYQPQHNENLRIILWETAILAIQIQQSQ
jgi:hypothetical protein